MTQTTSRLFDEIARLMTDAAGAAQGMRKEVETIMRAQAEKILRELDVVPREEFEAVRAMAQKAREENAALEMRLAKLEAVGAKTAAKKPAAAKPKAKAAPTAKKKMPPPGEN
ncbi:MAG: accessory factor UbiK family protein [Hyphomicrobiales bacterium]|nr:accessory factor UbiK family protein [Hyphomicrobiales bacterium]